MMDLTNCIKKKKTFNGANGTKISVIYNGEQYMLKFPNLAYKNPRLHYSSSIISEYIGSHIFNIIGIPAQETYFGNYIYEGKKRIVVACKDITKPGVIIQDFASLKNTIIDSSTNGYGTDIEELMEVMRNQDQIDSMELINRFWDMFIVDALIANMDRHNGNWGFLYNTLTDEIKLAPVYDCGSSLYPQADEEIMKKCLYDIREINIRVYDFPNTPLKYKGERVNYFNFISSLEYTECNKALKRIFPLINMEKIYKLIEDIEIISDLQKQFYKKMLKERYEKILKFSYKLNNL